MSTIAEYTGIGTLTARVVGGGEETLRGQADAGKKVEIDDALVDQFVRIGVVRIGGDMTATTEDKIREERDRIARDYLKLKADVETVIRQRDRALATCAELEDRVSLLDDANAALTDRVDSLERERAALLANRSDRDNRPAPAAPAPRAVPESETPKADDAPQSTDGDGLDELGKPELLGTLKEIEGAYQRFTDAHGSTRKATADDLRDFIRAERSEG